MTFSLLFLAASESAKAVDIGRAVKGVREIEIEPKVLGARGVIEIGVKPVGFAIGSGFSLSAGVGKVGVDGAVVESAVGVKM